jgi:hypothetical protein
MPLQENDDEEYEPGYINVLAEVRSRVDISTVIASKLTLRMSNRGYNLTALLIPSYALNIEVIYTSETSEKCTTTRCHNAKENA